MKQSDSLSRLSEFYEGLDSIPTPSINVPRPTGRLVWSLAPLGVSLLTIAFLSFCASGPSGQPARVPVSFSLDRYAMDELGQGQPAPGMHRKAMLKLKQRTMA
ncbi:MAG: hypothetical protein P4L46_18040 [Fimbriimonas sp.]|nr:hypothetical protein [Fimbriimonas sp.]